MIFHNHVFIFMPLLFEAFLELDFKGVAMMILF